MQAKCSSENRLEYGVRTERGIHNKGTDLGAQEATATKEPAPTTGPGQTANIPLGWFTLALICFACVGTNWLSRKRQEPAGNPVLAAPPKFQIDVNSATEAQLAALPDVGEVLAGRIVEYRQKHGPYVRLEDLQQVRGFGSGTLANLRPLLTIVPSAQ